MKWTQQTTSTAFNMPAFEERHGRRTIGLCRKRFPEVTFALNPVGELSCQAVSRLAVSHHLMFIDAKISQQSSQRRQRGFAGELGLHGTIGQHRDATFQRSGVNGQHSGSHPGRFIVARDDNSTRKPPGDRFRPNIQNLTHEEQP